ncbi:MAG TPA: hypothetical protein PLZ15_14890 [Melioribacteraceae bacterium]|nr:hypothetical protein [Melioribacteraceae bacterium]
MQRTGFHPLFLAGLIGSFIFGSSFLVDLIKVYFEDQNIYWTPAKLSLSLDDTGNSFQFFIQKEGLKKLVSSETLYLREDEGVYKPVTFGDIKIRMNNWNEQKSSILGRAVFTGFFFGSSMCMLIIGAVIKRKELPV